MEELVISNVESATNWLTPWAVILCSAVGVMIFKDYASNISKGISFWLKPGFNPGDVVYLDGEEATIISIGIRETIFEIKRDQLTLWRYISNTRVEYLKLEKIIKDEKQH
jgi:hypothetical protein